MNFDVILIHPPAIYDFRKKALFPGSIGYTVGRSTAQFITPSIGVLSIAEYLDRHGYRVMVDNIAERMITDPGFDAEEYIKNLNSRVFAVGLHWCVHSQGAIEVARLIKKLHPDSMVLLGGLTSTVFHEEIIEKYEFIDAVIRGEAEKPFQKLMQVLEEQKGLENVPNLTYRRDNGEIATSPLMEPDADLNDYEFTRLDLLEPKQAIYTPGQLPGWTLPIARGCLYNCVSCGGSAYSYRTHLGRNKPAFRSPEKLIEDLHKLSKQGVQLVFLCQDPRMGGKEYSQKLLKSMQKENFNLSQLTFELFVPADEEFMQELSKIKVPIVLTISPESGVDRVRGAHGRKYTNDGLLNTIKLCQKYGIRLGIFSMLALANDTTETIKQTWKSWEEIVRLNMMFNAPADFAFGPMLLLDPGSPAFDRPNSYGFKLVFNNFEDYVNGMSHPSWHQWISYETKHLDKEQIAQLTIDSIEYSINLRERAGFYTKSEAEVSRFCFVEADREVMEKVNEAMKIDDLEKREEILSSLRKSQDDKLDSIISKQKSGS